MKFLAFAAFAFLASPTVLAQSSSSSAASASGTASGAKATHTITVGQGGLVYNPASITAAVGDVVSFVFYPKNHTVTQSTFANPCGLLQNATTGAVGFDSGYVPVAANATSNQVWSIQVTATTPIWFYCKQTGHCAQGMVGAINAPTTGNTFDKFQAAAKAGTGSTNGTTASGNPSSGVGAGPTGTAGSTGSASRFAVGSTTGLVIGGVLAFVAALA